MVVNKIAYDPEGYISYKDYIFLASMINMRLQNMIHYDRFEQAIMTENPETAARIIAEAGWPDMSSMTLEEIDKVLNDKRDEIFKEIEQVCPESQVVAMMRLKYDYHNIKAIVKSGGIDLEKDTMLSTTGRIPCEKLYEDYLNNDYRDLPSIMGETMKEAKDLMARTQNPRGVDMYIDKMYFKEMFELAEELEPKVEPETWAMAAEPGESYALTLVKQIVDDSNLRTSVRVNRMGKNQEFLKGYLIEGGNFPIDQIAAAAYSGDGLANLFKNTPYHQAAVLAQEVIKGNIGITQFEKECAETRLRYMSNLGMMYFDARTVIWYLLTVETTILNVRMVISGLRAGVTPDKLKERLRQTYV